MKKTTGWMAVVVVLAAAGTGWYYWQQSQMPAPRVLQPVEPPPPIAAQPEPPTHYPLPAQQQEVPPVPEQLPPLKQSDTALRNAMADLFGSNALVKFFHMQGIVRRIVATIDNLPRKTVAVRLLPTQPVHGGFLTAGKNEALVIAPENAARYTPYVRIAEMVDTKKLVAVYVRFYPLFQQAYQDLGYPNGYFNDRLVAVIDHLLAAPEVEGSVSLVQPHILYQFADPALEASSSGHKIMLRMGSDNEERLKIKLRAIRRELTSGVVPHS